MIYCLTGKIIKKTLDSAVISCGGVGYFVQIPATTGEALPPVGKEGTVYTIMNVTENDVSLYGFASEEQRDCFKMLTAVTGVGPKAGLSILSIMSPEKVALFLVGKAIEGNIVLGHVHDGINRALLPRGRQGLAGGSRDLHIVPHTRAADDDRIQGFFQNFASQTIDHGWLPFYSNNNFS